MRSGNAWCRLLGLLIALSPLCGALAQTPDVSEQQAPGVAAPALLPAASPGQLKFSFRKAPWPSVLTYFAEQAGLTLDLTDTPPGNFNYQDDRSHTIAEALDVLNGYLLPRGYVTVRRDQFLVCVKTDNPVLGGLIPRVQVNDLSQFGRNELVQVVVPLHGLDPKGTAEQVSKLLGPLGKAVPVDATQTLVVQGFGKSLREVVTLLQEANAPVTDTELVFRAFPLNRIPATDAERQIRNLFGLNAGVYAPQSPQQRQASNRNRNNDDEDEDRNGQQPEPPTPLMAHLAMNMKVSSLGRTNSLLVTATPSGVRLVEEILRSIDVEPSASQRPAFEESTPVLRVYTVDDADQVEVAATVNVVIPGVVVNVDDQQDSIHVLATPADHDQVAALIETIEQGGARGGIEVVTLARSDPQVMSQILAALFANEDRDDRPMIQPYARTRSLAIRATSGQMAQIKQTLAAYGETGPVAEPSSGSRFRQIPIRGGDAERIAEAVRELLSEDAGFGNPVRVLNPVRGNRNAAPPVVEEVVPVRQETRQVPRLPRHHHRRFPPIESQPHSAPVMDAVFLPPDQSLEPGILEPAPGELPKDANRLQRVTIEVRDGELLVYSNDESAVQQVEEMIRQLVQRMPSRTTWTVFYLKAAAADIAAARLAELLRNPDDLGWGSPIVGVGAVDSGANSLRIVPDPRTNALFLSGPPRELETAGSLLEFLDRTELPESLRDRVPRAIPVKHADLDAVAGMIRELYRDFLEDPSERGRGNRGGQNANNGGNRGGPASAPAPPAEGLRPSGIRLTLAVDPVAGELLISCNESLYLEIRNLIEQRDQAALANRPVYEVIEVKDAGTLKMGQSLQGLSPRILVTPEAAVPAVLSPAAPLPANPPGRRGGALTGRGGNRGR